MPKLTKRFVESLEPRAAGDVAAWDDTLPGFGVRLKPSGVISYIVRISGQKSVPARYPRPAWRADPGAGQAEVQRLLVEIHGGPTRPKTDRDSRHAPTVAELAERYLAEHCEPKNKPRSITENRRFLEQFILPALGKYRVDAVTRVDVAKLHHTMRGTPYQANHVRAVLSKMFNLAEKLGPAPGWLQPLPPCGEVQGAKARALPVGRGVGPPRGGPAHGRAEVGQRMIFPRFSGHGVKLPVASPQTRPG